MSTAVLAAAVLAVVLVAVYSPPCTPDTPRIVIGSVLLLAGCR